MSGVRSGVPGGRAGTDWRQHDVPTMWQAVENQQGDNHWRLVSGWRRTAELTATHLHRLVEYRAKLAAAWPPDRNAAAAAYVARLDFLIDSVKATHEVAVANYSTFAATTGALASARRELKPIHDEYVHKRQAIREYDNLVAHVRGFDGVAPLTEPPATQRDLDQLNYRARAIMYDLSRTLVEAQAAIKHPPTYSPRMLISAVDPDVYGSGRAARPPTTRTRTLAPSAAASVSTVRGSLGQTTPDIISQFRNGRLPVSPTAIRPGVGPPPSHRAPTASSRPADSGISHTGPTPRLRSPFGGVSQQRSGSAHTGGQVAGRPYPVLPPGAIIGAPPGTSYAPAGGAQPSRINPVGGVIGGMPPLTDRRTGRTPGAQSADQYHHSDDAWQVEQGVAPVIRASEIGAIDPGPALGLGR